MADVCCCREFKLEQPLAQVTVAGVSEWLKATNMAKYTASFAEAFVSGRTLKSERMNMAYLDELKVDSCDCHKMMDNIQKLRQAGRSIARHARWCALVFMVFCS